MSLAESLEDPKSSAEVKEPARPVDPAAKLRKQVSLQFGAIVVLGLALTGWYVGFRIFAGAPASRQPVPAAITVAKAPMPAAVKPVEKPVPLPLSATVKPVEKSVPPLPVPATVKLVEKSAPPLPVAAAIKPIEKSVPPLPVTAAAKPVEKSVQPLPVAAAIKPIEKSVSPPPASAAVKPIEKSVAREPVRALPASKPVKTERPPAPAPVEHKAVAVPAASTSVTKPVVPPAIVQAVKAPQPVTGKESAAQPFRRHDASLHAGDRYLQIAAFGPRALDGYLKTLEAQGRHPLVAPGPAENIYRILIGPFPNAAALEDARRSIQASGIEPIVRTY